METTELTSRASPSWLNKWSMPFLWIILTPIVTVPLSAALFLLLAGYQEAILRDAAQRHLLMGVTTFVLAGIRVRQSFRPNSASLAAVFGIVFMALAFQLLLMPGEHH